MPSGWQSSGGWQTVNRELLERALKKTNELEEKERKQMRIASALGTIAGVTVSTALDTTVIWACLVFLIGIKISWLAVLGGVILFSVIKFKIKA